ncbi:MAG: cytochrome c biogenesis protein ResB [Prevotella sp.]|nr:cytochrome c biogenesis protein ResB [Prevotella sp.]
MRQGFAIGAGIIVAGLLLELCVGKVFWDAFTWPANLIVLLLLMAIITGIHLLRKKVYAFRFLSTYQAAIPAMIYAVVLTVIMGLTRQTVNGQWLNDMLSFWPFVLIYVYISLILGLIIIRRLTHFRFTTSNIQFILFHLGLFIVITTATLGNADMQRLKMITSEGEPEWRALDAQHQVIELPLAIELEKFIMETYDDGSPKRFASQIEILTQTNKRLRTIVDVNKPVQVDGWKIYQYGYDQSMGAMSKTSIFELVRDPWLPAVYTGIYMMLLGALCMFIFGTKTKKA